jgi:hypothetical protein
MPIPISADSRVSEELSEVIEAMIGDPEFADPVTLGLVRDKLREAIAAQDREADLKPGSEGSLYAEAEALADEFGEDMLASEFVVTKASESLSELIEAVIDRSDEDVAPTLGDVREAITGGLAAELAGEGNLDADDDQPLVAEIDALIERYGVDALAEDVLRFD